MKNLKICSKCSFFLFVMILQFIVSYSIGQSIPTPKRSLLAISKTNHTLSIIDPSTLKIISNIPVGIDPHEVVASEDGTKAFVCIYGGGSYYEINLIDLINQKPLENIDTRPLYGPHDITYINNKVWFTAEGSKSIGSYNPETKKIDWSMGTGQDRTHMIYVSPDAKRIYTTNISSGTISILEDSLIMPNKMAPPGAKPRKDWFHTIIPSAKGSEGFDVSPSGNELWTASSDDGSISVINPIAKKLLKRFDGNVVGANRLKFTPDGKLVFITSLRTGDLTIFDTKTYKEIKRIKLGKGAAGILMDSLDSRAFIACSADNYIAIIDLKTLEVVKHLEVGGNPDGLAWAIQR